MLATACALERTDDVRCSRFHTQCAGSCHTLGRLLSEADTAIYLASRAGDYVMGGAVTVDGGVSFAR